MTYTSSTQNIEELVHSNLSNKSIFNPAVTDNKQIEIFKKLVLEDVRALKINKK